MAEYFDSAQKAEEFLRNLSRRPVLYAKISLHGGTKWLVDEQRRNLGSSIQILDDLTDKIDEIQQR